MPDIQFLNSPRREEKRWKETRKEIVNEWFVKHGFLIVPKLQSDVPAHIQVIFPSQVDYQLTKVEKVVAEWDLVGDQFWVELDHYLPEARKIHEQVVVDVGRYGTISSSYSIDHYYLRIDRTVADLAAMIINQTLYVGRKQLGITWTKREALMDFIMTRPAMKKLFPNFDPVFTQLSRVSAKVRRESEAYVRELGIKTITPEFELTGGKIRIKGEMLGKELTKTEKKVLKELIARQGELVTYDELADLVWGAGEFKTFWALNKLVERLRPKLEKLGIGGQRIESVRGQGYQLN